ncbi:MAG: glycerol-3-phosphate dehydrogenase [Firmicutes bacterium]|nr:glycerol-3-phosphate dehydrogenase [Bacillota bacterium]
MSVITIIGAGMMGSAMSVPARDNGHEVRLVGTHLDREIIDNVRATGNHPKLEPKLPAGVQAFQIEEVEAALAGTDVVIGGISSFGVDWFRDKILPLIPKEVPVLLITKGLVEEGNGKLRTFPDYMLESRGELSISAVGGPCTSYELADRNHSAVCFCGHDLAILQKLKGLLETDYYHITPSTDVIGVEVAVAMKNAYALAVTLAVGMQERERGVGCVEAYNPQAALFGQAMREMTRIVKMLGGSAESIVFGVSDLYVTIFGGRTRKLGTLLGRGLSIEEALRELHGVTLESVAITNRVSSAMHQLAKLGQANWDEFPLLRHVDDILNQGKPVNIPWKSFGEVNRR